MFALAAHGRMRVVALLGTFPFPLRHLLHGGLAAFCVALFAHTIMRLCGAWTSEFHSWVVAFSPSLWAPNAVHIGSLRRGSSSVAAAFLPRATPGAYSCTCVFVAHGLLREHDRRSVCALHDPLGVPALILCTLLSPFLRPLQVVSASRRHPYD